MKVGVPDSPPGDISVELLSIDFSSMGVLIDPRALSGVEVIGILSFSLQILI